MKTVFAVNLSRYPYHKIYLELFKRIAEEYGDVQIVDMASSEPLHEIYYKISASKCDLLISFDCAGFELRTENDTLSYNQLGCRMAHIFFRSMEEYGENLSQQMNFSMFVFSAIWEDVFKLREDFPNVPNADWLEIPEDWPPTGNIDQENDAWVREWFAYIMKEAELIQTEKEEPLISVVLPTYNREKILKMAMESVLNQSYRNLELIVADDCSEDNTETLVQNMIKDDKRIRYIKGDQNAGANAARNMGASIASGDYIAFIDSDAVWKPNKLERQLDVFRKHANEEIGMVFHVCILSKEDKTEKWLPYEHKPEEFSDEMIFVYLLDKPLADTSTIMMPMQIWKATGGFDVQRKCLQDYEFSLRVAKRYKVYYFHEPLAVTYFSPGSVSQNWKEGIKTYFYVLEKYAEQYKIFETIKQKRIFLMWNSCRQFGCDEFFREELMRYVKDTGEDLDQLGHQMQNFIEKYTTLNQKWDIDYESAQADRWEQE